MEETYRMSKEELEKHVIIQQVADKLITQVKAAEILKLSDRQIRNLLKKLKNEGPSGFMSKKRGKKSNNSYCPDSVNLMISLIKEHYSDFGPTFAREKLFENHGIEVSVETVRKYMIEHHLHIPRKSRAKLHQTRPRRDNFGELIQADASIHAWFEDRGEKCALIVFIDDATSKITSLYFAKSECLEAYFTALNLHIARYGVPLGLFTDRHSIFGGADNIKNAQLVRACKELDIEHILARSPQAKGRVERANRTLQDRLIKEMRLRGISNIDDANVFLKEYIDAHNEKFSKEPRGLIDTHRPLDSSLNLRYILSYRETRTLSKDLCISFYNQRIKIMEADMINRLKFKKVNVIRMMDGQIEIYYQGKLLKSVLADQIVLEEKILDYKDKNLWKPRRINKPGPNHAWKKQQYTGLSLN